MATPGADVWCMGCHYAQTSKQHVCSSCKEITMVLSLNTDKYVCKSCLICMINSEKHQRCQVTTSCGSCGVSAIERL